MGSRWQHCIASAHESSTRCSHCRAPADRLPVYATMCPQAMPAAAANVRRPAPIMGACTAAVILLNDMPRAPEHAAASVLVQATTALATCTSRTSGGSSGGATSRRGSRRKQKSSSRTRSNDDTGSPRMRLESVQHFGMQAELLTPAAGTLQPAFGVWQIAALPARRQGTGCSI